MTRDVWIVRRQGRGFFGSVISVELSLLAASGLRSVRDADGRVWFEAGR